MKCPICKKEVPLDKPTVPFCSERCRLIDLGKWASEEYVISTPIAQDQDQPGENESEHEDDQ